jgi:NAD(P)-dependent dehydrogenase (short-subunit alcohol dehydrogenase family)
MTAIDSLLKDKRALVLGGGRGIGRAISLQLAEAGANLVLVDLERERAESVSKEIAEIGVAHPVAADVRRTEEVERAVRSLLQPSALPPDEPGVHATQDAERE